GLLLGRAVATEAVLGEDRADAGLEEAVSRRVGGGRAGDEECEQGGREARPDHATNSPGGITAIVSGRADGRKAAGNGSSAHTHYPRPYGRRLANVYSSHPLRYARLMY